MSGWCKRHGFGRRRSKSRHFLRRTEMSATGLLRLSPIYRRGIGPCSSRPQMWGFFFLNTESAFAFNWNLKWFAMLLSGFLFLRIVAKGDNFLALSGALLLLFAAYVQWWFSTPTCMPEMISMVFFGLWALHTMFQVRSRWAVICGGIALLIAIEQFVFCWYPRFQIPLAYLAAALLAGGWANYRNRIGGVPRTLDYFRAGYLILILLMIAAVASWRWFQEAPPTIQEIRGLIYPGQVVSNWRVVSLVPVSCAVPGIWDDRGSLSASTRQMFAKLQDSFSWRRSWRAPLFVIFGSDGPMAFLQPWFCFSF